MVKGDAGVDAVRDALGALPADARVVVGASGGPDSAGLLSLLHRARPELRVHAVHVRHGLRDDDHLDAQAARQQCAMVGADFVEVTVKVRRTGDGPESAARDARHAALQQEAAVVGAVAVLLGHTADDQAETVLLRLARGTTLRGAAGMRTTRPQAGGVSVMRPMLALRREDVHKAAAEAGMTVAHDPTNADPTFARNVVRAQVLPALGFHAGDPAAALARFAARAAEDEDHLHHLAVALLDRAVEECDGVHVVPLDVVYGQPPAIARRVVAELLVRARPDRGAVADEIDDVLSLRTGKQVDRRGVVVMRTRTSVRCWCPDRAEEPDSTGQG